MKRGLIFFILTVFFSTVLQAQPVTATADKKEILIGEQLQLHIKAFFLESQQPQWISIDTIPHFEIMEKSKVDTQRYEQQLILSQTITLTGWDSGKWVIPAFKFPQGNTAAIPVKVSWALPFDPKKPYNDIKDIKDVKIEEPTSWYWYFLAIILLIVLFMLFFPGTEKEKKEVLLDANAYQKAIRQIDDLESENLYVNDPREFFTKLTNIFRWYLQAGKGIQSYSKTSDDLSIQLQQFHLNQHLYIELLQALRLADMVKFARLQPGAAESKKALHIIRESIIAIEKGNVV